MNLGRVMVICFVLLYGAEAFSRCEMPKGKSLVLGYSYKLGWFTRWRINNSARDLGYKLQYQDLRKFSSVDEALKKVDAVLVPGGADIDPKFYITEDVPPEFKEILERFRHYYKPSNEGRARDEFEYALYQNYFHNNGHHDLPVLSICRGMQMLAVNQGIPLVLDLKAEMGIKNRYNRFDRFHVSDPQSLMAKLFPKGDGLGFKYHHQNPRQDYLREYGARHPDVKVTATSKEGRVVEAIEIQGYPVLGVQFHPEKSFSGVKNKIFSWLLTSACERNQSSK